MGVYRDGRGRCSALACRGPGGSTNAIDMWCSVFTKAALHGTELPGVGDGAPTAELSARGVAWTGRVDTERAHLSSARAGAIAWALPGLDTHVRATFPNVMACETTPNMVAISTTRGDCSYRSVREKPSTRSTLPPRWFSSALSTQRAGSKCRQLGYAQLRATCKAEHWGHQHTQPCPSACTAPSRRVLPALVATPWGSPHHRARCSAPTRSSALTRSSLASNVAQRCEVVIKYHQPAVANKANLKLVNPAWAFA